MANEPEAVGGTIKGEEAALIVPRLRLRRIGKAFPGTVALRSLSLDVRPGTVHALVGRNGAGKSTLVRIVSGAQTADGGTIELDGQRIRPTSPGEAQRLGIITVYQELSLVNQLSVTENVLLGRMPKTALGAVSWRAAEAATAKALDRLGFGHIPPRAQVGTLPMSERQVIEVAKALAHDAVVLLLDEPTASLSSQEVSRLAAMVRRACANSGLGVIYVSHRIDEVLKIADEVSVLRDGRIVNSWPADRVTGPEVVAAMVGEDMRSLLEQGAEGGKGSPWTASAQDAPIPASSGTTGRVRRQGLDISSLSDPSGRVHVDLTVKPGEILALAGLPGSGQDFVVECLMGRRRARSGSIKVDGHRLRMGSPRRSIKLGIGVIPADRQRDGLVTSMSIQENVTASSWGNRRLFRWGLVQQRAGRRVTGEIMANLRIKAPSPSSTVKQLSGGTQQKVVLGKWLLRASGVLVLDQPTRGIDIGSKEEIYELLRGAAEAGAAVLLVTYELEEAMMADRILIMERGRIARHLRLDDARHEAIYGSGV